MLYRFIHKGLVVGLSVLGFLASFEFYHVFFVSPFRENAMVFAIIFAVIAAFSFLGSYFVNKEKAWPREVVLIGLLPIFTFYFILSTSEFTGNLASISAKTILCFSVLLILVALVDHFGIGKQTKERIKQIPFIRMASIFFLGGLGSVLVVTLIKDSLSALFVGVIVSFVSLLFLFVLLVTRKLKPHKGESLFILFGSLALLSYSIYIWLMFSYMSFNVLI